MRDAGGGWTFETLRIHLETQIGAVSDRLTASVEDIRRSAAKAEDNSNAAITAAKSAQDIRLAGLNELRDMTDKILAQAMLRPEAEAKFADLAKDLRGVEKRLGAMEGRGQGFHRGWLYALGALSAIASLLAIYGVLQ